MTRAVPPSRRLAAAVRQPMFVGRQQELAALGNALGTPPAVVLIEGAAGIGKSRLLGEYFASAAGSRADVLTAGCLPMRQPHTLGPIADALRQVSGQVSGVALSPLAGALRPLFPEWAGDLPPLPDPLEDASAVRHRLFRALAELLGALDVQSLVIEDVHWADEATVEFLAFLMSLPDQPVNVVATYRGEDLPAGSVLQRVAARLPAGRTQLRLVLHPLDIGQTAELMSSMLDGAHVSEQFAGLMHERTDGVPLAVEESVRLLGEHGDLQWRGGMWVRHKLARIVVPLTVREAVLERAARLGADAQVVLQATAVLNWPASEATVRAVSGLQAADQHAGLVEALRQGLLEDRAGLVSFRHALAAQAVYEAIPAPDRRGMHLRAARVLEDQALVAPARLAGHFREAGETDSWLRHAERAADQALASGDPVSAVELLYPLVAGADLPARSLIRLTEKMPVYSLGGDRFEAVLHALHSAVDAGIADAAEEGELRYQLGRLLSMTERYDAGRAELEKGVPLLAHQPFYQARAMLLLGWSHGTTCHASVHYQWLQRAAAVLAATALAPAERLGLAVDNATALLHLGESDGWALAAELPEDALGWAERAAVTRGHLNFGELATHWGRNEQARRHLTVAADLAARSELWRLHSMALANQAHLDYHSGNWDSLAGRAAALASDANLPETARLEPLLISGLLNAATGSLAEAEEQLQRVYRAARARTEVDDGCEAAAALARLWLAAGQIAQAVEITEWPAEVVASKGNWLPATEVVPVRVAALAAAGDIGRAGGLVSAFAGWVSGHDAPAAGAAVAVCQALLTQANGSAAPAAELFGRAVTLWQTLQRPYEAHLAQESQARCLLADGQQDNGLEVLAAAGQGLTQLGASRDADRVAALLRKHGIGVPRPWRGGRRGYGEQLSPREADVVRLLVAGQTRRQIADALYRSPKTVDQQLRSAMRKLGVTSRAALAEIAVQAGAIGDADGQRG